MSGNELDQVELYELNLRDDDGELVSLEGVTAFVVSLGLCDEQGNREKWTKEEARVLGMTDGAALRRIYEKIQQLSGRRSPEESAKN